MKDRVEKLLIKHKHLRDNDNKLQCNIWYHDLNSMGLNPQDLNAMQLLEIIANDKLSNPKTIRRYRAKLQEERPELRGHTYRDRQTKKQDLVQSRLGYHMSCEVPRK